MKVNDNNLGINEELIIGKFLVTMPIYELICSKEMREKIEDDMVRVSSQIYEAGIIGLGTFQG
jgi:hypothetical protein